MSHGEAFRRRGNGGGGLPAPAAGWASRVTGEAAAHRALQHHVAALELRVGMLEAEHALQQGRLVGIALALGATRPLRRCAPRRESS